MKTMHRVSFANGIIVDVLANTENQAVKLAGNKGGYGSVEVYHSPSLVEAVIDTNLEIESPDFGDKLMYRVEFENGILVDVIASDESEAVELAKVRSNGINPQEVWEIDSIVESVIDTEIHDNGEAMGFINVNSLISPKLKSTLAMFMRD